MVNCGHKRLNMVSNNTVATVQTGAVCSRVWSCQDENQHQVEGHGPLPENSGLVALSNCPKEKSLSISRSCWRVRGRWHVRWTGGLSAVSGGVVPDYCGEGGTEPQGKSFDLLVDSMLWWKEHDCEYKRPKLVCSFYYLAWESLGIPKEELER